MNKRDRMEAGGKVLDAMMDSFKQADAERAKAAKEKAERRKAKYATPNGK